MVTEVYLVPLAFALTHHSQARYCGKKLWKLRNSRDKALHLLLFGAGCSIGVQEWLIRFIHSTSSFGLIYRPSYVSFFFKVTL